jgi:hypothetical protein
MDSKARRQIDIAYDRWKSQRRENAIFWEFIEQERNNILKEYRFNLHPLDHVDVAVMLTAQQSETGKITQIPEIIPIGENIYRPVLDGYSEGDDARDVYREALDWWNAELTAGHLQELSFRRVFERRRPDTRRDGVIGEGSARRSPLVGAPGRSFHTLAWCCAVSQTARRML